MSRPITLLLVAMLMLAPAAASAYQQGEVLLTIQDTSVVESSGLASSSQPEVLFTHNDSGDRARFFAIGPDGHRLASYELAGAVAIDWEDMARGLGANGSPALFFADIGDNSHVHPFVTIYEVPEPVVDDVEVLPVVITEVRRHVLVYEDAGRHDAETLLVDPDGYAGFTIVTKHPRGASIVFTADGEPSDAVRILRRAASLDLTVHAPIAVEPGVSATGGAVAPDRSRLVIRTYWYAFEWALDAGMPLADALAGVPEVLELPSTPQGEAITYSTDGADLLTSTEGADAPVHILRASAT